MKIFLENLYHSDCYFLPIRDNQQDLVGVELITHFSSEDGTVRIPTSRVIAQLTEDKLVERLYLVFESACFLCFGR